MTEIITIFNNVILSTTQDQKGRFFRKLLRGKDGGKPKPSMSPLGINTIAKISKDIAVYLKLSNPGSYTSHAYRRTAATLLAESGCSLNMLKIVGGWRSSTAAEGYIGESMRTKKGIADMVMGKENEGDGQQ